jgi:glutaredoxin
MKIEVLTTPGCSNCKIVEKFLDEMGFEYSVVDVTEKPDDLQKYPLFIAPGIVIDGKLEFTGIPKKEKLVEKLTSKSNFSNIKSHH